MMTALGYHYFVYWTSSFQPFLCIANYIFTFCQSGFFNPVMFYLDYLLFWALCKLAGACKCTVSL